MITEWFKWCNTYKKCPYIKESLEIPVTFSSLYSKQGRERSYMIKRNLSGWITFIKLFSCVERRACRRQEEKNCWSSTWMWKLDEKDVKCSNLLCAIKSFPMIRSQAGSEIKSFINGRILVMGKLSYYLRRWYKFNEINIDFPPSH